MACEYSDEVQQITKTFPSHERFSRVDQLNRSSSSISDNIAEGSGAVTTKDFANYLQIADKSTYESVSQIYRCSRRGYITETKKEYFLEKAQVLVAKIISFKKAIENRGKF